MSRQLESKCSVLYRWRDQYRRQLERRPGRPPGVAGPMTPRHGLSTEDLLRQEIATLQRNAGPQAMQSKPSASNK